MESSFTWAALISAFWKGVLLRRFCGYHDDQGPLSARCVSDVQQSGHVCMSRSQASTLFYACLAHDDWPGKGPEHYGGWKPLRRGERAHLTSGKLRRGVRESFMMHIVT